MDRRDALKSFASLAGAAGLTVTPVTTQDAAAVTLVLIRSEHPISQETTHRIAALWRDAVVGTDLEGVKTAVLSEGLTVEFVRGRAR